MIQIKDMKLLMNPENEENKIKKRIGVQKCCISTCNEKGRVGFFNFPTNPDFREKWMKLCGLTELKHRDKVCYKHFDKDAFVYLDHINTCRKRLRYNVLPTLFLPEPVITTAFIDIFNFRNGKVA